MTLEYLWESWNICFRERGQNKVMIWIILLAGLALRLISLNQSLWLDEATTAMVSKMPLAEIFTKFLPGDFHPPLYYLLMKGWVSTFGSSEIVLRMPSIIFGLGVVYFVYKIGEKVFDKKTAVVASLLSATSGLLIYYSQEARMYMFICFLVTAAIYFFVSKKWLIFSILLVAIGITDYIALLIVPVFLIFGGKDFKKVIKSLIPLIIVLAIWSPIFLSQLSGGLGVEKSAWWGILGTLSWKNLALIPVKFILGRISFDNTVLYGAISISSVLAYLYFVLKRPLKESSTKILWGWLLLPIIFGILVSIKIPVLTYFRFIFTLPALYLLTAAGITKLTGKKLWIVFGTFLSLNIFFTGKYLLNNKFHREDWRGAASAVGSDIVVYPANSQREALTYYGKDKQIVYYQDFVGHEKEIWLSRYVWNIFDLSDNARIKIEKLGYNKVQELNLSGVEFWKYKK